VREEEREKEVNEFSVTVLAAKATLVLRVEVSAIELEQLTQATLLLFRWQRVELLEFPTRADAKEVNRCAVR